MAGNVILQVPIGLLADRYGRRTLLGICAAASCVGPLAAADQLALAAALWPLLIRLGRHSVRVLQQGIALLGEEFAVEDLPAQ